jgi:hypothetical protein
MSCPKAMSATPARFRHVIQFHVVRALQDVHVLVLAGGAFEEVIAHPLATPFAAHDLQGLRQEAIGHVVCVATLAQFSASRASNRARSSAHSITTVPGFRLSLHIGCRIPAALNLRLYEQETASRELEEIGFRYSAINAWVQDVDCEVFHCFARSRWYNRSISRASSGVTSS